MNIFVKHMLSVVLSGSFIIPLYSMKADKPTMAPSAANQTVGTQRILGKSLAIALQELSRKLKESEQEQYSEMEKAIDEGDEEGAEQAIQKIHTLQKEYDAQAKELIRTHLMPLF